MKSNRTASADRRLLASLARLASGRTLNAAFVAKALGLSRERARKLLARLARRGWLSRLRRGTYSVPALEAHSDRPVQPEDPWVLARDLFEPAYIGGWSAAEHWGLTEQVFRSTFVVTVAHARHTTESIGGLQFRIVRVAKIRSAGITQVWRGSGRVSLSDRERTIVDALVHPDWLGGIRNVADALQLLSGTKQWSSTRLTSVLTGIDRRSACKRLGYLLEALGIDDPDLIRFCLARRSTGYIRLDPSVDARGKILKRWGLILNVDLSRLHSSA